MHACFIRRGRRWIASFPYAWDKDVYLEILSRGYFKLQLVLRITFVGERCRGTLSGNAVGERCRGTLRGLNDNALRHIWGWVAP